MTENVEKYYRLVVECIDAIRDKKSNAFELAQEMTRLELALTIEERAYIDNKSKQELKEWFDTERYGLN